MKEAVSYRNAFATAHSSYAMSVKNIGAALSDYANGEVQNPQLAFQGNASYSSSSAAAASAVVQAPFDPIKPPPPPPPSGYPPPLQRAASMPEFVNSSKTREPIGVGPTIIEENDADEEDEIENQEKLILRKRSSSRNKNVNHQNVVNSTSPERHASQVQNSGVMSAPHHQHQQVYDYFFNPDTQPGSTLEEVKLDKVFDERPKREEYVKEKVATVVPPVQEQKVTVVAPPVEEEKKVVGPTGEGGSVGRNLKRGKATGGGGGEKRVVKGSVNLLQIFKDLDDHFLKTSESAHDVSKMLEATRLHYHSNFADNRGNFVVRIYFNCL